jgi:hypothetical protein
VRLEAITAEVRPRNRWEAMDLGLVLARKHYPALLKAWAVLVLPVWALILILCRDRLLVGLALIWWTEPLAERVPLLVLSREMFGERLTIRELLRYGRSVWFRDFYHVLVRVRMSFSRYILLPVRQLEELRGRAFQLRAAGIVTQCGALSWVLQVWRSLMVFSLSLSMAAFLLALIPERYAPDWEALFDLGFGSLNRINPVSMGVIALYLISVTLVTPFCVAAGFGLYLNARTKMEGWDIEIAFRKLAARIAGPALSLFLCLGVVLSADAVEDDWDPQAAIEEILAEPEFKVHTKEVWTLSGPQPIEPIDPGVFGIFESLTRWFAQVAEILVGFLGIFSGAGPIVGWIKFVLIGVAAAILILAIVKWSKTFSTRRKLDKKRPEVQSVMGMSVGKESLPKDVIAAVRELLAKGDFEGGMALLYRGALVWLIHQGQVPIQECDTEFDCVARVQRVEGTEARYFEWLTRIWSAAAYGARRIGPEEIERLLQAWPYRLNQNREGRR